LTTVADEVKATVLHLRSPQVLHQYNHMHPPEELLYSSNSVHGSLDKSYDTVGPFRVKMGPQIIFGIKQVIFLSDYVHEAHDHTISLVDLEALLRFISLDMSGQTMVLFWPLLVICGTSAYI